VSALPEWAARPLARARWQRSSIVIVSSWLLTWFYVWWANNHYDARLDELKREGK